MPPWGAQGSSRPRSLRGHRQHGPRGPVAERGLLPGGSRCRVLMNSDLQPLRPADPSPCLRGCGPSNRSPERCTRKPYRRPKLEKPRGLLSEVKQVPHLCETIRSQSPTATGSCPPPNPSRGGGQLQPPKIPRFSFSFSPTSLLPPSS